MVCNFLLLPFLVILTGSKIASCAHCKPFKTLAGLFPVMGNLPELHPHPMLSFVVHGLLLLSHIDKRHQICDASQPWGQAAVSELDEEFGALEPGLVGLGSFHLKASGTLRALP